MALKNLQSMSDADLKAEEAKVGEQLFRLRFQQGLGDNAGVNKLRGLKKDVARIKTLARQRALGIATQTETAAPATKSKKAKKA
ncbi:MAG: 50S ribosomal protein L29 [Acidobacteria bacterium]|nr:50S ribosomal protein L29 [Acidobacteriota bacterium]